MSNKLDATQQNQLSLMLTVLALNEPIPPHELKRKTYALIRGANTNLGQLNYIYACAVFDRLLIRNMKTGMVILPDSDEDDQ